MPRKRGRPRAFDRDAVLDRAVDTFWSKGYSATSLDDLTDSMGINRPSLYGAFGNKHALFLRAIGRYAETVGREPIYAFLEEKDIVGAIEAFFATTIACVTSEDRPPGCLIMNVAAERAARDEEVRARMAAAYEEKVRAISDRISAAQSAGRLPADPDADSLARMIVSIMHGIAARARVGADRAELSELAANFLRLLLPRTR